jgi:hypothetical protein
MADLKKAFLKAQEQYKTADDAYAKAAKDRAVAIVWMARSAYAAATHPSVVTKRYPVNVTQAAKALDIPYATLYPYVQAGLALAKKQREGLLSVPDDTDISLTQRSLDEGERARQTAKRVADKKKKEELQAAADKLAALEAAKGDAEAPPAEGTPAEAEVPPAPAPSLAEEAQATARQLVAQVKLLREEKAWSGDTAASVVAILSEAFPVLSK